VPMSRHLMKIKSLVEELSDRYGDDDPAVQQMRLEVAAIEALERERRQLRPAPQAGAARARSSAAPPG